jgi:hypothetical protein
MCGRVESHQELRKCVPDTGCGQHAAVGTLSTLPREVHVLDGSPRQAELGVGQSHQPGPAIGLRWSPHAWGRPVEGLFTETVGVFQIKPMDVGSPDQRQIGLARSTPPQPQGAWGCASGAASARPRPGPGCPARWVWADSCIWRGGYASSYGRQPRRGPGPNHTARAPRGVRASVLTRCAVRHT